MDAGALVDTITQFSAEVERMLGTDKECKFAEVAGSIVKYGMDNHADTASGRIVYEQWNKDLEGEYARVHAMDLSEKTYTYYR